MKKTIIQTEQNALEHLLERMFGYYLLQMGGPKEIDFLAASSIKNKIHYAADIDCEGDLTCVSGNFDSLPFKPNSIDVIMVQHILEIAMQPQKVLQEVYRVLIPEGHLIVVGFNPISLYGLVHLFKNTGRKFISIPKLDKWLLQIGFNITKCKLLKYSLLNEGIGNILWPGRDIYVLAAQKKTIGLTPVPQKRFKKQKVAVASPYVKPAARG